MARDTRVCLRCNKQARRLQLWPDASSCNVMELRVNAFSAAGELKMVLL